MSASPLPIVGVSAESKDRQGGDFHVVGGKYLEAVLVGAGAMPVILPAFGARMDLAGLIDRLDGLMLTGSPSNVYPPLFGAEESPAHEPYDHGRDATTLPLIKLALEKGVPLLGICRGFQEINVALGGTLTPKVSELPGRQSHYQSHDLPAEKLYGPFHGCILEPGSQAAALFGTTELQVNSLHYQAIDKVADDLVVEGRAPDGTPEFARVKNARGFAMAAQWHPEYKASENADSMKLLQVFGDAVRQYAAAR